MRYTSTTALSYFLEEQDGILYQNPNAGPIMVRPDKHRPLKGEVASLSPRHGIAILISEYPSG